MPGVRPNPRRLLRRHRRLVAAALAGLAALILIVGLRDSTAPNPMATAPDPTTPRAGEVTVPVVLASAALAAVLDVGDVIDLVSVADPTAPSLVASGARVLQIPATGGMLSSASSAVVLVAVDSAVGLDVTAAASEGGLTFVIPGPSPETAIPPKT